jgi:glycosyltransferase involved in cell wall biosynthesis
MRVSIVSSGIESRWRRLQPYRTLLEMGRQLSAVGHNVTLISDGAHRLPDPDQLWSLRLRRVPSVRLFRRRENLVLARTIDRESPDLLLWHLSLSSFIHQDLHHRFAPMTVGVLTSPIHRSFEILRLGVRKLSWDPDVVAIHLSGSLVPGWLIRRAFSRGGLRGMISLSETTRRHLIHKGAPAGRIWAVPPGVDQPWLDAGMGEEGSRDKLRCRLGFREEDFVVTYFGSPSPIRGLHTLLRAAERILPSQPQLRLLILSRRRPVERERQAAFLDNLIDENGLRERIQIVDGFLQLPELVQHIAAGDAVCLPFELVPSDMPLSILEAMALGQGVVSTNVACIPELIGEDRGFLVPPASVSALGQQLEAIVQSPSLVRLRGQRARAYVETERTWAGMGSTLQQVLVQACEG